MQSSVLVLLLSALLFEVVVVFAQVEFPEHFIADKKKSNLAGRIPLYSPTRCGQFELLYPGDQKDDWICDCAPAAVYHPETDACYPVFRQGPCKKDEMFVLGQNKILPECIANDCKVDGQIRIKKDCFELGGKAPCKNPELSYVLGVDPATLQVDCVRLSISLATRFGDDATPDYDLSTIELCARGTQRAIEGRCPEVQ